MALDPLTGVLDLGGKIIDKIFPDKTQADQAKAALAYAQVQGQLADVQASWANLNAQAEVDKVEAGSASLFVAGARPAAMWVCVIGLGLQFIVRPIAQWILGARHPDGTALARYERAPDLAGRHARARSLSHLGKGAGQARDSL